MSLSSYLWGIRLFTLFALCAWLGVVVFLDPEETGSMGLGLFAISFLAWTAGILTLFVTQVYRKALGDARAAHHLSGAFRQALLLAFYGLGVMFLQYLRILTWWDALLWFAVILLIEFSFRRFLEQKE